MSFVRAGDADRRDVVHRVRRQDRGELQRDILQQARSGRPAILRAVFAGELLKAAIAAANTV